MNGKSVLGIIFANIHEEALDTLTAQRTMGSVPFCSRYRLIDFPLSNMVESGITKLGVITNANFRSLMDHVGTGKPWDLSRKNDGLYLLPSPSTRLLFSCCQPASYLPAFPLFSESAIWKCTDRARQAQSTFAKCVNIFFCYFLTCHQSWQYKVKYCPLCIHYASRQSKYRY